MNIYFGSRLNKLAAFSERSYENLMATDRSPKAPRNSLKDAVTAIEKLFAKARRAPVTRESAANAVGYSGLTGSSLTLLASLIGYGLLDRKGQQVLVSERAIGILHPKSEAAKLKALKDAALANPVFQSLAETHIGCDQDVIENELIHQGFSPEAAKKTASVFISNSEFASLDGSKYSHSQVNDDFEDIDELGGSDDPPTPFIPAPQRESQPPHTLQATQPTGKMIAEISVPLAGNQLTLALVGNDPVLDEDIQDIDSLIDYLKRQLRKKVERATVSAPYPTVPAYLPYPAPIPGIWKNKDHDKPTTFIGIMKQAGLEDHYMTEDGTGVPASEVEFK